MIGQPTGVCLFLTCKSTRTKYFADEFRMMEVSKSSARNVKATKSGISLCEDHVDEIILARQSGEAICISPEGWVYIDNWNWLLYSDKNGS